LGIYDKVPIDIWAMRALTDLYDAKFNQDYDYYQSFYQKLFPEIPAYPAQYLFEYIRKIKRSG